jgi:hypothetical protein
VFSTIKGHVQFNDIHRTVKPVEKPGSIFFQIDLSLLDETMARSAAADDIINTGL